MSAISNKNYPNKYESWLRLRNGENVFLRPIIPEDRHLIVDLFNRMSHQSVWLRFLRNLDSLSEDMIQRFTHMNYNSEFALAAVIMEDKKDSIVAVGRYGHNPDEDLTELALAVRDDWQHIGLGKKLLKKVVDIAGEHGIRRFTGMMDPENNIIRHILSSLGYNVKYSPKSGFFHVDILV